MPRTNPARTSCVAEFADGGGADVEQAVFAENPLADPAGLGVNAFLKGGVPVACQGERDGPFHVRENIVGDGGWLGLGAHKVIVTASRAGHYTDAPSVSCLPLRPPRPLR